MFFKLLFFVVLIFYHINYDSLLILQLYRVNLYSYEEFEKEFLLEATEDELYDEDPRQECQSEVFQV